MINKYQAGNKFLYEVFVKGRDKDGKQIGKRRRGITSIRKAKEIEVDLINELRSKASETKTWTWQEWHLECIRRMRMTLKMGTVMGYDGDLKKWLPQDWCEKEMSSFSKNDVYDLIFNYIGDRASAHIRQKTYKRVLRLFELAVEDGIINRNPAKGIRVRVPEANKKVLNSNEADLLLRLAKECHHRFYYHWAFALFTGMRNGEMYALRWSDIDLETGLISVTKQWTSKDGLHHTKSNRNRVVPISAELRLLLSELKKLEPIKACLKPSVAHPRAKEVTFNDLVLPRLREWRSGDQAAVLTDFCKSIDVTPVKFHDLRATFITNLLSQGVALVKVMSIVGHRKMSTTDEYLRLAGVDVKTGTTEKLGYSIPKETSENVISLFGGKN
ncbi:MAG: hypothetical protein CME60_11815 [Halobacteriovoraceae bacterium]|nr:hypothetical protein [Halobacteriovoraceae bacterium]|tara:strand:- start:40390 stop:41547 length:1158 start_codon:yes stop_codon:yes gene_type:complete